jgi:amino-acid racemase
MRPIGLLGSMSWESTGAEAIVLGCMEITLLIRPADVALPVFDTTTLHADAAVAFAVDVEPTAERTS